MKNESSPVQPDVYRIRVEGRLDPAWREWFHGMDIALERERPPITSLTGPFEDQAKLRGILSQIWDLNLTVISLSRVANSMEVGNDD